MKLYKRVSLIAGILLLICFYSHGQFSDITGVITDEKGLPLIGSTVALLRASDSVLISGTNADVLGTFRFEKVVSGNYLMEISFVGYADLFKSIALTTLSFSAGNLILKDKTQNLGEVVVEGKIPPAQQNGDTTQYNANAFKTNPDANAEDLVTKMPGVVLQDGKVQAQGEDVKTVLVDGKPFFGDDPNTVLKNIPAEIIDKIQVFDRKSDQTNFTGVDDGNTSKTINIITRPEFRNGIFGKVFAGYGNNDRYKASATVNFFKNKRRTTVLVQSNNINEQNFSIEDLAGVISAQGGSGRPGGQGGNYGGGGGNPGPGGGRSYGGQGNDAGFFLVNQNSGINTTHAAGLNYANQLKKFDITGSYFFNLTNNRATGDLFRQYSVSKYEGLTYTENKLSAGTNTNHRANFKVEYKIDSMRSILVQPKFTGQLNSGKTTFSGLTGLPLISLGSTENQTKSKLDVMSFSAPILFRNSFRKKGRTFSLNLTPGYNTYIGKGYLISNGDAAVDSLVIDSLDQYSTLDKKGFTLAGNITYTEPVTEKFLVNINYMNNYNNQRADKETYNKLANTDEYSVPDSLLTNNYAYTYFSHTFGGGIRFQQDKINISISAGVQRAAVSNHQISPNEFENSAVYYSFLPNAMFMYKFTEKKNLRFSYRTYNTSPTIEQLQSVIYNTNPLQLTTGNPDLKQDWLHNFNLRYSAVNTEKSRSLFFLLNFSYTNNYIGNSTIVATQPGQVVNNYVLQEGSQITQPVNFEKAYNFRSFLNYSFVITPIKSNINLNAGFGYSNTPGLNNKTLNYSRASTPVLGVSITSNISKNIDFTISSNTSITQIANSAQTQLNSDYLNQATKLKLNVLPWKWLVLQTDITHQYYTGLSESYNERFFLWNAGIGYKFLKNQVAELRFSVHDILDQNKSITRNTTESYYEDIKTNVLGRYFMLTFTYNLKFFKEKRFVK